MATMSFISPSSPSVLTPSTSPSSSSPLSSPRPSASIIRPKELTTIDKIKKNAYKMTILASPVVVVFLAAKTICSPINYALRKIAGGISRKDCGARLVFQKLSFEWSAVVRQFKQNYHQINIPGDRPRAPKLILGAMPNHMQGEGEDLVEEEGISAVLSLNEEWERETNLPSMPYSKKDWEDLGVQYQTLAVKDHTLLDDATLDKAADWIHEQMEAGRNVYVHCRAGVGRSGMAIAAYLIKYKHKSAEEAAEIIVGSRNCATVHKKKERLEGYVDHLIDNGILEQIPKGHVLLKSMALAQAADGIHAMVEAYNKSEKGKADPLTKEDLRILCKAGKGPSVRAVIAYLIKYEGMKPEAACTYILGDKYKKLPQKEFAKFQAVFVSVTLEGHLERS